MTNYIYDHFLTNNLKNIVYLNINKLIRKRTLKMFLDLVATESL